MASEVFERRGKVILAFHGRHTIDDAASCLGKANTLFRRLGKCEFVVDLRDLESYDPAARTQWQENLAGFKTAIHTVTMIGGSPLARMSGAAVCLYAGLKMRFAKDLEEATDEPPAKRA